MVDSPVMKEVRTEMKRRFEQAKAAEKIPKSWPFQIMSFPGSVKGQTIFRCIDPKNTPISAVEPYETTLTICDRVS